MSKFTPNLISSCRSFAVMGASLGCSQGGGLGMEGIEHGTGSGALVCARLSVRTALSSRWRMKEKHFFLVPTLLRLSRVIRFDSSQAINPDKNLKFEKNRTRKSLINEKNVAADALHGDVLRVRPEKLAGGSS